jgi:hypothetical protein
MSDPEHGVTQGAAEQAQLLAAKAQYLISMAARAPSVHNSQPWRFRVGAQAVELWCDPWRKTRDDALGREMLISCGAALFGLWRFSCLGVRMVVSGLVLISPRRMRNL